MYGIYSRCRNRARVDVGLSVVISVTVSLPSNKVRVVIINTIWFYSLTKLPPFRFSTRYLM